MEQDVIFFAAIFLTTAFAVFFLAGFIDHVIEPFYMTVFKRPLYVFFHPVLKKLPASQKSILQSSVPFYNRLTERKKKYFEHRIAVFIVNHEFHGKNGQVINDEVRVMIASTFIMLTFGMRHYITKVFDKVIVYPDSYHSTVNDVLHNGEFNPRYRAIVFSWKHFVDGNNEGSDNLNLGIHEFAHALHYYGIQRKNNSAAIFAEMYNRIMKEVKHPPNAKSLIDSSYFRIYAYTNQYEFLAVILEHFFETPHLFRKEFPELFLKVQIMINSRD